MIEEQVRAAAFGASFARQCHDRVASGRDSTQEDWDRFGEEAEGVADLAVEQWQTLNPTDPIPGDTPEADLRRAHNRIFVARGLTNERDWIGGELYEAQARIEQALLKLYNVDMRLAYGGEIVDD